MNKPFNTTVIETKQKIVEVFNESGLPLSVCSMILNEITLTVNSQLNQTLINEKAQLDASNQTVANDQTVSADQTAPAAQ